MGGGRLVARVVDHRVWPARSHHQDPAGAVAGTDEDVVGSAGQCTKSHGFSSYVRSLRITVGFPPSTRKLSWTDSEWYMALGEPGWSMWMLIPKSGKRSGPILEGHRDAGLRMGEGRRFAHVGDEGL
jgi:hypothetical protein